jgi:hypothetical protein
MSTPESKNRETVPFPSPELFASKAKSLVSGAQIRTICMFCKRILQEDGSWKMEQEVEVNESNVHSLSHGLCPHCLQVHYPEVLKYPN